MQPSRLLVLALLTPTMLLIALALRGQVCGVQDASYATDTTSCGTATYELTVYLQTGEYLYFGSGIAYGACDGGYWDCSDSYVDQGYVLGSESMSDDGGDEYETGELVHWTLDDWTVAYTSCNNGNSRDTIETQTNTPYESQQFDANCSYGW